MVHHRSATSFALQAIGPSITSRNVQHLQSLELVDVQLFGGAVEELGDRAAPLVDRATAGARELGELTGLAGA